MHTWLKENAINIAVITILIGSLIGNVGAWIYLVTHRRENEMGFPKTWTEEEELFLAENCLEMSAAEIAKHLGKTKRAVAMKKFHMTIGSNDSLYEPVYMTKEQRVRRIKDLAKEMRIKLMEGE